MSKRWKAGRTIALAAALSLGVAACGGGGDDGTAGGGGGDQGNATKGGTLKLVGFGDVDHLDTSGAYYQVTYTLLQGTTRQLVSYNDSADEAEATKVVADIAEEVPQPTANGTVYTFKIREGAQWGAPSGPRQITAEDEVVGLKRLCNPVVPTGAPGYYKGVIKGMTEFCDGFAKVKGTAAAIKDYINNNDVSGIQAVDDRTVKITLEKPAPDFLNIMALPFSSPVPEEMLQYVPDSPQFRKNFISSGPYKIDSYKADTSYSLSRNDAWTEDSDPIRKAYVDKIQINLGQDEGPVQKQIEAGTADMAWDLRVPLADLARLKARKDPKLTFHADGSTNPYFVMNQQSPTANGALKNLKVRQAINYAVNKQSIIQVIGGPDLYQPLDQILTPTLNGYQQYNLYPTPDHKGDPAKAKQLLSDAGYPDGLTLKFVYRTSGKSPAIATTLQNDLAKAGIKLKLIQTNPTNFYVEYLQNPDASKRGDWDVAAPGWGPDWQGPAARSFFVPLLDGRQYGPGSTNYGNYNSDKVNQLIDQALSASSVDEASKIWAEADKATMQDAPWVPLVTGKVSLYHSKRLQNCNYGTLPSNCDIANVWIDEGAA